MKTKISLLFLLFAFIFSANAQIKNEPQGAASYGTATSMRVVQSIASRGPAPAMDLTPWEARDKKSLGNKVIIGKDPQTENDRHASNPHPTTQSIRVMPPSLVFDGYTSGGQPTDPAMAVGPNHAFVVFNTGFAIYDKAGNDVGGGQRPVTDIFSSGGCCDLTASYDAAADRWVISYLWSSNGQIQVAVSDGADPTTALWNVYTIPSVNDYNKLSVWSDGYYVTANGSGNRVWALERDKMIAGDPTASFQTFILPGIVTSGFQSPQAANVSSADMPATGGLPVTYMQDDAWSGVATGNDHVKLWTIDVDWTTPANSMISAAQEIPALAPFISVFDGGSFVNLPQPGGGTSVDALQATIMNQMQFRKFATHNSMVFNFVVDVDAGGGKLAGIRWFEYRQPTDNGAWSLFQEGTYTAPDGRHAWHGSMIMDKNGNIALGYTSMAGPTTANPTDFRISSYYTGRFDGDAAGTMTVAEELISAGSANIPSTRYGDYGKMDIDPSDDETFWFINEYFNGGRKGIVGVFTLAPNTAVDDIGVTAINQPVNGVLTATETIEISIKNHGTNDITNPAVQYTVDAGTPVVENYAGTIVAGATETFTFAATADLSALGAHVIVAKTNLAGDTNTGNDEVTKTVTNAVPACVPTATQGCNLDGIKMFVLNTISVDDGAAGCNTEPASSPQGYADRTGLSTQLLNTAGNNVYTLQAQQNWSPATTPPFNPGDEGFAVWIDFDDSGVFEPSELLIDSAFQTSEALEDFTLTIPVGASLGAHRLRAKAIDITGSDVLTDPCADFSYGEVQDYTVNIVDALGVNDPTIEQGDLIVTSLANNQFDVKLTTTFDGIASIAIYNMLGQTLAFNNLEKEGDSYNYGLDMSYAASGVYLIKIGSQESNTYKTAKIIVK